MGLLTAPASQGQLVLTPHPVTLEGQQHFPMDLRPGESLYAFLQRNVEGLDGSAWNVSIGGMAVPRHLWHYVYPKHGQVIEVRGAVGENALYIIAFAVLTYFTFGAGAAWAGAVGVTSAAGAAALYTAVFIAGSIIINKVLGPKVEKPDGSTAGTVFTLGAARNRSRPYEPLGLLFGSVRIAADVASNPYTWYEGNDQFLGMVLTPGIGCGRVEQMYNGDALLSSYEGVTLYYAGFAGMPNEQIPLYSNADTVAGGELDTNDQKGTPSAWVQRTTSTGTIRIQVDMEFSLFDVTSKGKRKQNSETIQVQYCPTGSGVWEMLGSRTVHNDDQTPQRTSIAADVPEGQYDVRVRIAGINTDGSGATAKFTWSSMTSVQRDTATYAGISRIGVRMKATGQLNGAPDELRCVAHAEAIPVWRNGQWVTEETGNPGAHILKYARGYFDENGVLIAGMGKPDEEIDIEALKGFMVHCEANAYSYNYWLTEERTHDEVLDAIALAGFGQKTWASGRLSVAWAAADQPLSGVVNMATIKKGTFKVDYTLASAADGIEYSYFDRGAWDTKTLRVPAPGITTMLNPARLTGEGIDNEAHAVQMARYHLAQSLYQYKDIEFSQDLEYLSYRRLSLLALSHDLTQWGFSGRVVAAERNLTGVTLTLDEPVPGPAANSAFIGLRIPGETVYRVFAVVPFSGERNTIVLSEDWPEDAALPGEGYNDAGEWQDNPALDTIWIYDFKATPGYRVRVVGIEPESDLGGASIAVVPESPELWTYVKTGQYFPPEGGSSLNTRPIASNLQISEDQVIIGDVAATDLAATFEITGPFDHAVVYASAADGNGELQEVAQTRTRTARWRIPRAGTYTINVRPFNSDGAMGVGASIIYTTIGADAPPVNFDLFDVEEVSGGIRRYTWGFWADTIQSANLAGAEIRYLEADDDTPQPAWETMKPVGAREDEGGVDGGYHTGPFDSPIPPSGKWTFAIRARNTNGTLSVGAKYLTKTLGKNLGELHEELQQAVDQTTQQILEEFLARVAADQELAEQLAAQAADLANLQALVEAPEWEDIAYAAGSIVKHSGGLYVAKEDVPQGTALSDTAYWTYIGQYASLAEAVGAIGVATNQITTQVQQLGQELEILANDVSGVQSSLSGKADASAVQALTTRVTQAENTITSLSQQISSVQSSLSGKADASALQALQTQVTQQGNTITSQGNAITSVKSQLGGSNNRVLNPSFETDLTYWSLALDQWGGAVIGTSTDATWVPGRMVALQIFKSGSTSGFCKLNNTYYPCEPGRKYIASAWCAQQGGQRAYIKLSFLDSSGAEIGAGYDGTYITASGGTTLNSYGRSFAVATAPSNARFMRIEFWVLGNSGSSYLFAWFIRPQVEEATTDQTAPSAWVNNIAGIDTKYASATSSLSTRVTSTENGVASYQASWTMSLDVNNRAVGLRSVNNGTLGTIDFVFDKVRFLPATSSGGRAEMINGNYFAYAPNGVQVIALGWNV